MTAAPEPAPFAIYTRQSVDSLKDLSTCQAQFGVCMEFARASSEWDEDWIVYRCYRCRSFVGGRQPCRGRQYPAAELERFLVEVLQDPETWRSSAGSAATADGALESQALAALWVSLDGAARHRLLPKIVDRVEFSRANRQVPITLNPQPTDVVSGWNTSA